MIRPTNEHRLVPLLCAGAAVIFVILASVGSWFGFLTMSTPNIWLFALAGGLIGFVYGRQKQQLQHTRKQRDKNRDHLQQFYQNTPALLYSMDSQGRILHVSQSWLNLLGYDYDQVIGRDFFDFVVAAELSQTRQAHFQALEELGEARDRHYLLRRGDDSTIEVSISETARFGGKGELAGFLAVLTDLTDHRAAEDRIERLACYDPLTGLPNRALLYDRILQSIAIAQRENREVGIFFFDLDRFKLINDTQGHAVGDMVLRSVAHRLKKYIRSGDTFARLGGDEFVIVQADPNHMPNFSIMGRRILETLGQPFQLDNREFYTTASIGVAIYPGDGETPETLLKSADTAMYVAKSRGRNNMQFFSIEMNTEALAKSALENRLRKALSGEELALHYQPQIDLKTGRIAGVEALLRWHDNKGEQIPPQKIINVAEECGLILQLGEWVLQQACTQARRWQQRGLPAIRMSVNLSGHHIRQSDFIDRVEAILCETGLNAENLEIELSEHSVMGYANDSILALTDLKIRGVELAIDNFGTGYSSLLHLKHLPISRIKIPQEFTCDIIQNADYASIAEAILFMARSLNLQVTAVGVEDPAQLDFLEQRGCTEVQGQLFGAALNAEEMAGRLEQQNNFFEGITGRRTDRTRGKDQPLVDHNPGTGKVTHH